MDADLAKLYGVTTRVLNQAVKRNLKRFPAPFMFQLTGEEFNTMRSQIVTASKRNIRYMPFAFTEHGTLMAANVLNSMHAITMSVEIILAFIRVRRLTFSSKEVTKRVGALERGFQQHDEKLKTVFDVIRKLMAPSDKPHRKIGFHKD